MSDQIRQVARSTIGLTSHATSHLDANASDRTMLGDWPIFFLALRTYSEHSLSKVEKMPHYRSRTSTHGRNMAGARGLWRATGMTDGDFGKPIIAIVNSFTQFVPGHVHLKDLGQLVAR